MCLLFGSVAYAEEPLILEANSEGQVIVEKDMSQDGNEYILNDAVPEETYAVKTLSATTFATMNYQSGLFDLYPHIIDKENSNYDQKQFDNNLSTYTSPGKRIIKLKEPVDVYGFFFQAQYLNITFLSEGKEIHKLEKLTGTTNYRTLNLSNIDEIHYQSSYPGSAYVFELDFFVNLKIEYIAASNIAVKNITNTSATLTYKNPDSDFFTKNDLLLDGQKVATTTDQTYELQNLKPGKEYTVTIRSYYTDGKYVDAITTFTTTNKDTTPPGDVTNLKATENESGVLLEYNFPSDTDFSHVEIYKNGVLLIDNVKSNQYIDKDISENTRYSYKVISLDINGNKSPGVSTTIQTLSKEVVNLKATTTSETVTLTWKNPDRSDLETVTIYRKGQGVKTFFKSLFASNDGYTAIFETNGNVFKDLTVQHDTKYTYKLTTTIDGNESQGVEIEVKTKPLTVDGGGIVKDPNGDFVITWTSPTTGKIQVLVGGKDYAIVPASDKKIVIPKNKMVFDILGNPDVKLIPIDGNGNTGVPSKPGGGGNGGIIGGGTVGNVLNPGNVLDSGVQLLAVIGAFVLLGLAFRVVPKLVKMIRNALLNKKDERIYSGRRRVEE